MRKILIGLGCFSVFLFIARFVFCVEEFASNAAESEAYNVTRVQKMVDGHVFWVEEDRPIEKVAGLYRPMDMDAYIQLKFSKLQTQINELASATQTRDDALQAQIDRLAKTVDQVVKKQDDWIKRMQNMTNITAFTNTTAP